ncbi:MAG: alpha/beta hydrolase [Actinobacteria bacterium]|nr:alpha/beta hydrolase [Actinomycetota bacterium]
MSAPETSDRDAAAERVLAAKGHELAPAAAELLRGALASERPNAHLLPVEQARRNFDADFAAVGPGEDVAEVRDHRIPVEGGAVPARSYRPAAGTLPAVVYLHGGGWLLGSVESHEAVTRALANAAAAVVVSVGYRRGPEARFPTAVEDAYAALLWTVEHAAELGVDPRRVAVAGDSAGGNLATAVARLARDRGGPALALQVLAYPVTTTDLDVGFDGDYQGYFLYRDELQWHQDNYLADPGQRDDPLVSPLEADDLAGLCPALVITAQCDPLHRQGELYAEALARAGVAVEQRAYAGMVHGFFQLPSVFEEGRDAVELAGAALRRSFDAIRRTEQ